MNKTENVRCTDFFVTAGFLAAAAVICLVCRKFSGGDSHVPLIFVLAVVCVARFTNGYLWGIAASVLGVISVNYAFTYPYFKLNFTLTGYPLTFIVMLTVAICVSTLTTQIKSQEAMRLEIEREHMRSNLLRAISHDIRTPLTSIAGSASALLENDDGLDAAEKHSLLTEIRKEAEWLNRIVENLLSVTRFSGEGAKLKKTPELAEEITQSAVRKFCVRYPEISVQIQVPEEPLLIPMDPILIEQVLVNLLENAAVHGGRTTKIRVEVREKDGKAVFSVMDNGCGIDAEVLKQLLRGEQLPGNIRSERNRVIDAGRSMGIGLSVCRSILDAHKGSLKAENLPEGGAAFHFTLPLEEEEWKSVTES